MARRRKHAEHENHERWLVSYADFITLLFAFFVVMFASSQTDKAKAQQVSDSVKQALQNGGVPAAVREVLGGTVDEKGKGNAQMKGPGGTYKTDDDEEKLKKPEPKPPQDPSVVELLPSMEYLANALEDDIRLGKVKMQMEPRGLVVTLQQAAFFPSGEDTISTAAYQSIEKISTVLKQLPNPVRLEGHTDSIPISTPRFRSNWDLSAARAIAMMELLGGKFGVPRNRLAIAGYADTIPVQSNEREDGRARNRRVDLVILARGGMKNEPTAAISPVVPATHH